jgi:plasmid stability protein
MASLLIRNVDDQLIRDLKRRAQAEHRSVQQLVHRLLMAAIHPPLDGRPLELITVSTGRRKPMRRQEIVDDADRS